MVVCRGFKVVVCKVVVRSQFGEGVKMVNTVRRGQYPFHPPCPCMVSNPHPLTHWPNEPPIIAFSLVVTFPTRKESSNLTPRRRPNVNAYILISSFMVLILKANISSGALTLG